MTVQPTRDQLRALANAATPGPWEVKGDELDGTGVAHCCMPPDPEDRADMEFIAAARTALPQLLDQLDQAEADRDWNLRSSRLAKEERIKANARAERAEQRARDLTQEVREERGAARDQMEQVRIRDARIKAVRRELDRLEILALTSRSENIGILGLSWVTAIRRALEG